MVDVRGQHDGVVDNLPSSVETVLDGALQEDRSVHATEESNHTLGNVLGMGQLYLRARKVHDGEPLEAMVFERTKVMRVMLVLKPFDLWFEQLENNVNLVFSLPRCKGKGLWCCPWVLLSAYWCWRATNRELDEIEVWENLTKLMNHSQQLLLQ